MDECQDRRLRDMLHSYELGLLSEEDQIEFEKHFLDCPHCLAEVDRFKDVSLHLRHSANVQESLAQWRSQKFADSITGRKRRLPRFAAVSLVTIALVTALILRPWHLDIHTTDETLASGNSLLIMPFDNIARPEDPDGLGDMVTSLLNTDMAESRDVRVISGERVFDVRAYLKTQGIDPSDPDLPMLVADQVQAKWLVKGEILSESAPVTVAAQLEDAATGNIIASRRVEGRPDQDVFSIVDDLAAQIRDDMALPVTVSGEQDRAVSAITTRSWEAYREYRLGVRLLKQYHTGDAERAFRRAIGHDSTFAAAYYHLIHLEGSHHLAMAQKYAYKADRKIQLRIGIVADQLSGDTVKYIAGLKSLTEQFPDEKEAFLELGRLSLELVNFEEAETYFNRVIEIDPLYAEAYNHLAYLYVNSGDGQKAVEAADNYIAISAHKANPYDTRADISALTGDVEGALASYRQALQSEPPLLISLESLGNLAIMIGDYDLADSCFTELAQSRHPWLPSALNRDFASIELHQGRFTEGLQILERDQGVLQRGSWPNDLELYKLTQNHLLRALTLRTIGLLDSALTAIREAIHVNELLPEGQRVGYRHVYCELLAESGNAAIAEQVSESLRNDGGEDEQTFDYLLVAGYLNLATGRPERAVTLLEKAAKKGALMRMFPVYFKLGAAYVEAGQFGKAVSLLKKHLSVYSSSRAENPLGSVLMHYYLGRALEGTDQISEAIEQYEVFLDIWKDADPVIESIVDAKQRLARLQAGR